MYFDILYKFCLKHFSFYDEFSEILSYTVIDATPCGKGDQTTDHIIQGGSDMTGTVYTCLHTNQSRSYLNHLVYACERLTKERDRLKKMAIRTNKWPINKRDLVRRHKEFTNFINKIQFDKLT